MSHVEIDPVFHFGIWVSRRSTPPPRCARNYSKTCKGCPSFQGIEMNGETLRRTIPKCAITGGFLPCPIQSQRAVLGNTGARYCFGELRQPRDPHGTKRPDP